MKAICLGFLSMDLSDWVCFMASGRSMLTDGAK